MALGSTFRRGPVMLHCWQKEDGLYLVDNTHPGYNILMCPSCKYEEARPVEAGKNADPD